MSLYKEMLDAAERLGLHLQDNDCDDCQELSKFEQLVQHSKEACELELKVHQLTGFIKSRSVTDQQQLHARITSMEKASSTCQKVCCNKDALADRLRSAKTRPSVPVAPAYQQDFSTMMQHSASDAALLTNGVQTLLWARNLNARPSCWEDQLECIVDAAKELNSCITAMDDFSKALVNSSTTGGT